jgi:hypothetical protein
MGEEAMIETYVIGAVATLAAWDVARRFARIRERETDRRAQGASDAALNLDKRVRDLESGQRELIARTSGQPALSRFQRKA